MQARDRLVAIGPAEVQGPVSGSLPAVGENQRHQDRNVEYDEHHVHSNTPSFNALHPL